MKHFLIFLILLLVLTGCRQDSQVEITKPVEINPVYNTNITQNEVTKNTVNTTDNENIPKVTVNPDYFLIDLIDTNLDLDTDDEQIIIVKDNSVTDHL